MKQDQLQDSTETDEATNISCVRNKWQKNVNVLTALFNSNLRVLVISIHLIPKCNSLRHKTIKNTFMVLAEQLQPLHTKHV